MEKNIFRINKNKDNPYVQLDKRIFENNALSWKAKGLLGYLLSKPDNWTVLVADIIKQSTDGRDAVYSGIKELRQAGYVHKEYIRDDKGRMLGCEYIVYELPFTDLP